MKYVSMVIPLNIAHYLFAKHSPNNYCMATFYDEPSFLSLFQSVNCID
jgi:hypothetical protein